MGRRRTRKLQGFLELLKMGATLVVLAPLAAAQHVIDKVKAIYFHLQDPNEEYSCCYCSKPTRPRHLFCSEACAVAQELD